MKRIIIAVVALVALIIAGAPVINGILMEKVVKQYFQDMNGMYAESGSDLTVQVVDYRRGLTSTEIEWKLDLGSLKPLYGIDEIVFSDQARHGYRGITSHTSLMKNSWYADFVNTRLNGKDPLAITTKYNLGGNIISSASLQPFNIEENGTAIQVQPAHLTLECDEGLQHITVDSRFDGLSVPGKLELGNLAMNGSLEKISTYIWDGSVKMKVGKTSVTEKESSMALSNLATDYTLDYDEKTQKLSVSLNYGTDQLTVNEDEIGPMRLKFAVNNLDSKGYEEFMELYTATLNDMMKDLPLTNGTEEELKKQLEERMGNALFQFMAAYEKLLQKDLQFEVADLSVELPDGEVKGNFLVQLKKNITLNEIMPIMGQPALVLDLLDIKSDASLPKALLGDDPNLLTPLFPGMQTGIFIEKGDRMIHSAETKNSKLYLNGTEVML